MKYLLILLMILCLVSCGVQPQDYEAEPVLSLTSLEQTLTAIPAIPEPKMIYTKGATAAAIIWDFMKEELNWPDVVCAGVMGNLMAETGGCSFDLDPMLYDANTAQFYGICQWSIYYYPEVKDTDLNFQLNFLKDTIEKEFEIFGRLYEENFSYQDFVNLQTPEEVALCFAIVYERCAANTYWHRIENAFIAFKCFCSSTIASSEISN